MNATKEAAELRFKIGDRVRVKEWGTSWRPDSDEGIVFSLSGFGDYAVKFSGWTGGHDADFGDKSADKWWLGHDNLDLVSSAPVAKFQVVYIDDGDETFDTQEAAEARAYDLAHNEPGSKFAVLKRIATATTGKVAIERFA